MSFSEGPTSLIYKRRQLSIYLILLILEDRRKLLHTFRVSLLVESQGTHYYFFSNPRMASSTDYHADSTPGPTTNMELRIREYQLEMLNESLKRNVIVVV